MAVGAAVKTRRRLRVGEAAAASALGHASRSSICAKRSNGDTRVSLADTYSHEREGHGIVNETNDARVCNTEAAPTSVASKPPQGRATAGSSSPLAVRLSVSGRRSGVSTATSLPLSALLLSPPVVSTTTSSSSASSERTSPLAACNVNSGAVKSSKAAAADGTSVLWEQSRREVRTHQ